MEVFSQKNVLSEMQNLMGLVKMVAKREVFWKKKVSCIEMSKFAMSCMRRSKSILIIQLKGTSKSMSHCVGLHI